MLIKSIPRGEFEPRTIGLSQSSDQQNKNNGSSAKVWWLSPGRHGKLECSGLPTVHLYIFAEQKPRVGTEVFYIPTLEGTLGSVVHWFDAFPLNWVLGLQFFQVNQELSVDILIVPQQVFRDGV